MAAGKPSLGACFGGLREATCKGNRTLEAYAKRMGVCVCLCVCVCVASLPLKLGDDDRSFHSSNWEQVRLKGLKNKPLLQGQAQ